MNNIVYQYPACTSCKKALKWLGEKNLSFEAIHIVEETPDAQTLKTVIEKSGLPLKKFFNTSGKKYRELRLKDKLPTMTLNEAVELLSSDGMLIKRPLLIEEDTVLVGFKENDWEARLGGRS